MVLKVDNTLAGINDHYSHLEAIYTKHSEHYVSPPSDISAPFINPKRICLSAFYLPQFHRLAINDRTWGPGFTEWTNVTRAHPFFPGHLQPHLPADLGFYDLSNSDTLERQVKLATHYGISSFTFHYYWFGGQKIMDGPINTFLSRKDLNMNFSICWANENWTKRWDGRDKEIILQQPHSYSEDKKFIYDIIPYLSDSRYLRLNGKLVLILYRPSLLGAHLEKTLDHWRKTVEDAGLGSLLIFGTNCGLDFEDKKKHLRNLDGIVQFPPHGHWRYVYKPNLNFFYNKNFSGSIGEYKHAIETLLKEHDFQFPLIPGVFPSWDNTARKRSASHIYINSNPNLYQFWLENAIKIAMKSNFAKNLVFINAWNEWAEGAHLEPCRWYGHAHLQATRNAIINSGNISG